MYVDRGDLCLSWTTTE